MMDNAAGFAGRQLGEWVAGRWGTPLREAFEDGKGLSGPLARALLDAAVVEQVVGVIWPSFALLAALLGLHATAVWLEAPVELERIATGLIVLAALGWTAYGVGMAAHFSAPHLRFWWVTRLPPGRQARLILFHLIRDQHHRLRAALPGGGFTATLLREALATLERRLGLSPDHAAFALADHLAPMLLRHLLERVALLVLPVAAALLYYRFAIYPGLLAYTGAGAWTVALYPLAALTDAVLSTDWRAALLRPS
ncbi:hypothetical protein [Teichococcus aestuarii]|uniref:hypothetical protein n=1 Tax=Teichococcus aestuarii TaxID=568898 RepID=UPI003606513F